MRLNIKYSTDTVIFQALPLFCSFSFLFLLWPRLPVALDVTIEITKTRHAILIIKLSLQCLPISNLASDRYERSKRNANRQNMNTL